MIKLIRYDGEFNPNQEALKGRYGQRGEKFGSFIAVKNMLFIILYKGASVTDYELPAVYDGFLQCSDGSAVLARALRRLLRAVVLQTATERNCV